MYKAPFKEVIEFSNAPEEDNHATLVAVTKTDEATKVVTNIVGEKTMLVPGLQTSSIKTATFQIIYKGVKLGDITLPRTGNYNLGRRSSDCKAQIKVAPDMTMSRLHAAMRTVKAVDGKIMYQITTIKPENPVYVNGTEIGKGKICNLKTGDKVRLGETELIFKLA